MGSPVSNFELQNHKASEDEGLQPIRDVIIFVKRSVIKGVLNQSLIKYGLDKITTTDSLKETMNALLAMPRALLVIDWEHGEATVIKALQVAQGQYKVDTRPIYFLASELTEKLISIASDYNICQVHIGEITPKNIQDEIRTIAKFEFMSSSSLKVFSKVAHLRGKKDWKQAEELLRALVLKEPDNIRAGLELGENYFETDDYERAYRITSQMLEREPDNLRAQHLQARVLMKQGKIDRALEIMENICNRGALNVDRLIDWGSCLLKMDRYDEASKRFEVALKLDFRSKKARLGKSQCALLQGEINQAMLLMRQVADDKEVAAIFNNAAIFCMRRHRFDKGLDLYKVAMSQVGRNSEVLARITFNMGLGYFKWGKLNEAKIAFDRAVELDPSFEKARFNFEVLQRNKRPSIKLVEPSLVNDPAGDINSLMPKAGSAQSVSKLSTKSKALVGNDVIDEMIPIGSGTEDQEEFGDETDDLSSILEDIKSFSKDSNPKNQAPSDSVDLDKKSKKAKTDMVEKKKEKTSVALNENGELDDVEGVGSNADSSFDEFSDSYFQSLIDN